MNRGELLKEYAQAKESYTQLTKELDVSLKRLAKARNELMDNVCLQMTLRRTGAVYQGKLYKSVQDVLGKFQLEVTDYTPPEEISDTPNPPPTTQYLKEGGDND